MTSYRGEFPDSYRNHAVGCEEVYEHEGSCLPIGWFRCDDCREGYEGPAYYTIGESREGDDAPVGSPYRPTGTLCPDCTGPYIVPDDPNDPRMPGDIISVTGIAVRCDICGKAQMSDDDWNGETGCHVDCEHKEGL